MEMRYAPQTTRVYKKGKSQTIDIPAEYRFEEDELFVNKIGDTLVLTPKSLLLQSMRQGLEMISDDFMQDGRPDEVEAIS